MSTVLLAAPAGTWGTAPLIGASVDVSILSAFANNEAAIFASHKSAVARRENPKRETLRLDVSKSHYKDLFHGGKRVE